MRPHCRPAILMPRFTRSPSLRRADARTGGTNGLSPAHPGGPVRAAMWIFQGTKGLQSGVAGTICSIYVLSADPPHAAAATALRHTLSRDCLESVTCRASAERLSPRFPRRSPRPRPPARACRGHVHRRRRSAHPVRRSLPRAPCHIYVLLEHKSRVDHGTPLHMLNICAATW